MYVTIAVLALAGLTQLGEPRMAGGRLSEARAPFTLVAEKPQRSPVRLSPIFNNATNGKLPRAADRSRVRGNNGPSLGGEPVKGPRFKPPGI